MVEEAEGWAVEISTDIETANAICQKHCHIVLVEATTDSIADLEAAEETAVRIGHEAEKTPPCTNNEACDTEVSNSWGGSEPPLDSPAFDHPGTVITASAGDDGYLNWTMAAEAKAAEEGYYSGADYPASSPHVVAVGGTRLSVSATGAWKEETVWNDDPRGGEENYGAGGGGCSTQFSAPEWQREVPDWAKSAAAPAPKPNAPSLTSPPTPTPTVASPSTTRFPTTTKKWWATRSKPSTRRSAGGRSAAPASPRRSSPRCSRSPAARTASNIRRRRSTNTLAPDCCTPSPPVATANATPPTPPAVVP